MRKRKPWIYIVGILVLAGLMILTACQGNGGTKGTPRRVYRLMSGNLIQ